MIFYNDTRRNYYTFEIYSRHIQRIFLTVIFILRPSNTITSLEQKLFIPFGSQGLHYHRVYNLYTTFNIQYLPLYLYHAFQPPVINTFPFLLFPLSLRFYSFFPLVGYYKKKWLITPTIHAYFARHVTINFRRKCLVEGVCIFIGTFHSIVKTFPPLENSRVPFHGKVSATLYYGQCVFSLSPITDVWPRWRKKKKKTPFVANKSPLLIQVNIVWKFIMEMEKSNIFFF